MSDLTAENHKPIDMTQLTRAQVRSLVDEAAESFTQGRKYTAQEVRDYFENEVFNKS
ncbi:MAG: hypothetical protein HUJ85_05945 [Veillonella sp.]|nr:hypothetical protein [Veillonella sp.]